MTSFQGPICALPWIAARHILLHRQDGRPFLNRFRNRFKLVLEDRLIGGPMVTKQMDRFKIQPYLPNILTKKWRHNLVLVL